MNVSKQSWVMEDQRSDASSNGAHTWLVCSANILDASSYKYNCMDDVSNTRLCLQQRNLCNKTHLSSALRKLPLKLGHPSFSLHDYVSIPFFYFIFLFSLRIRGYRTYSWVKAYCHYLLCMSGSGQHGICHGHLACYIVRTDEYAEQ